VVVVGKGRVLDDGRVRPLDVKPGDRVLSLAKTLSRRLNPRNARSVMPIIGYAR
jgi:hypothetical protein